MASNTQDNVNLAQGVPTVAVGQSLKTARELTGKGLGEVAQQLRIRQPFLEALEEGRHKDLPGGAYAIGFLRTYAEFLNLDGEEMVRRFRAEAAGDLNSRSELVFPSPVSEGRIPGGAVLFLGLVLAGVAYGAWYFLSSSGPDVAEMVPPLPDRLASALNRPATVTGDSAKTVEDAKAEEALPTAESKPEEVADKDQPEPLPSAGNAAKDGEVVPPAEEEDTKAQQSAPVAATPSNAPTADVGKLEAGKVEQPKPAAATPPAVPTPPPAAIPTPPPTATQPPPAAVVEPPPPAAEPAPAPAAEGKVIGQEHTDSRVQLKAATDDCWVQVREMDGQLLLSRLLRKGDSYIVPNRPGLTLMVGNAGALEVLVDGKTAPSLGSSGQVRRDIKLDPEKLLGSN